MVEGARLESVYVGNCIEGSNPSLTAILKWIFFFNLYLFQSISVILSNIFNNKKHVKKSPHFYVLASPFDAWIYGIHPNIRRNQRNLDKRVHDESKKIRITNHTGIAIARDQGTAARPEKNQ